MKAPLSFLMLASILGLTVMLATYMYCEHDRYSLETAKDGPAYKIDRKTGRIWWIVGDQQRFAKDRDEVLSRKSPEEKAFELAKGPLRLGNMRTDSLIKEWLENAKGELRIRGWEARKVDAQTYLVSYTLYQGSAPRSWYFEVNLAAELVRPVDGDPQLETKYGIAPASYYNLRTLKKE